MRILSGIKPSGALHVGNYFGMIKPMIDSQQRGQLLCFIANLHSQTSVFAAATMHGWTRDAIVDLLALGMDPEASIFFVQSDVPEVCELAWYLNNVTPVGLLQRCHAYKDSIAKGVPANAGLFNYPVLMAADILLYQSTIVPVGRDQKQHVEVTRDIAIRFNQTYGEAFTLPEPQIREDVAAVPGLDGQKMSKSYGNTIEIFAPERELKKKIMGIVTDSTPVESPKDPETSLIYAIYRLFVDEPGAREMAERFRRGGLGYGAAKKSLLEAIDAYFGPFRAAREALSADRGYIDQIRKKGAEKARSLAIPTLEKVRSLTGIGAPVATAR